MNDKVHGDYGGSRVDCFHCWHNFSENLENCCWCGEGRTRTQPAPEPDAFQDGFHYHVDGRLAPYSLEACSICPRDPSGPAPASQAAEGSDDALAVSGHIEPTDNAVARKMRQIYCCKGAEFCRPDLEAGWREIWRLEAALAAELQAHEDSEVAACAAYTKNYQEMCAKYEAQLAAAASHEQAAIDGIVDFIERANLTEKPVGNVAVALTNRVDAAIAEAVRMCEAAVSKYRSDPKFDCHHRSVWLESPRVVREAILATLPATVIASLEARDREMAAIGAQLEQDRTQVADGITAVIKAIKSRDWLTEGRGSYEWDDDKWHTEFAAAAQEILDAIEPLRKIAADWTGCPKTWKEIVAARETQEAREKRIVAAARLKALNEAARETHGYCDATELMRWFDDRIAELEAACTVK